MIVSCTTCSPFLTISFASSAFGLQSWVLPLVVWPKEDSSCQAQWPTSHNLWLNGSAHLCQPLEHWLQLLVLVASTAESCSVSWIQSVSFSASSSLTDSSVFAARTDKLPARARVCPSLTHRKAAVETLASYLYRRNTLRQSPSKPGIYQSRVGLLRPGFSYTYSSTPIDSILAGFCGLYLQHF